MNDTLMRILNHPKRVHVAVGVASFVGGVGAGYIFGRRRSYGQHEVPKQMSFNFDRLPEGFVEAKGQNMPRSIIEESEASLPWVRFPDTEGTKIDPSVLVEDTDVTIIDSAKLFIDDRIKHSKTIHPSAEEAEPVMKSVFAESDDGDWNYEEELKKRDSTRPYIIHKDEFFANETEYTQSTLNYYAGDNIMTDEVEVPVYDYESRIGPLNFGHGSGDMSVFYVRNDKRKTEYEVLLNRGTYSEEVLGLEIENNERKNDMKHSNYRFQIDSD